MEKQWGSTEARSLINVGNCLWRDYAEISFHNFVPEPVLADSISFSVFPVLRVNDQKLKRNIVLVVFISILDLRTFQCWIYSYSLPLSNHLGLVTTVCKVYFRVCLITITVTQLTTSQNSTSNNYVLFGCIYLLKCERIGERVSKTVTYYYSSVTSFCYRIAQNYLLHVKRRMLKW